MVLPPSSPRAAESGWERAAAGLGWWRLQEFAPVAGEVPDEPEPLIVEAPGPAFDTALLTAALGMAQRPVAVRESLALVRRLAGRPHRAARPFAGLAMDAARVLTGRSRRAPWKRDRRYADRGWQENPLFRRLAQLHEAAGEALEELVETGELDPDVDYKLRLAVSNLVAALSPANFPLSNPAALKAMIDTGGRNLITGLRRLYRDVRTPPRLPVRSEPSDFELGNDVAATPGAVVLRTELMELIQYEAVTEEVRAEPLLIVPSVVNKFYLTDLAPGKSLVEFAVSRSQQTFCISWRNPDAALRHLNLDSYTAAIIEALDTVLAITGAGRAHTLGVCAGGQLLTIAVAYLAAAGALDRVATMSLPVCVIHHEQPGSLMSFLTPEAVALASASVARRGVLEGAALQGALAWLRPIDSIWWAWVHRYLLAEDTPKLDLFFWSEDITNLPGGLVADLLRLTVDNALARPGALTVLGKAVDVGRIELDAYVIAGLTDHLTRWQSCYQTASALGPRCEFILVAGGHLQAILRPPGGRAVAFRAGPVTSSDPATWLAEAQEHVGSWWEHWIDWLDARSSGWRKASGRLGSLRYSPIEPAPGSYVRIRASDL